MTYRYYIFMFCFSYLVHAQAYNTCHPAINPGQLQYIVGYGSLISEESRHRTIRHTGNTIPVNIMGYQRGWFLRGPVAKYSTTYLGVTRAAQKKMNAVVFKVLNLDELPDMDAREEGYCRELLPLDKIQSLTGTNLPTAEYWIYVPQPKKVGLPDSQYPIVQSYVDIFLSGCLEMERKYQLNDYARQCITTTSNWSPQWINDRIYPRRPLAFSPEAENIDKLLSEEVADAFNQITLENSIKK